jgi:hypothetical protein
MQVVVRTDEDAIVSFSVEDPASVPAGLVAGTRVTVRYALGGDGRYRVVRVGVASYPPEPGSTTSLPPPPAEVASPPPPQASPPPPTAPPTSALNGPAEARPATATASLARARARPKQRATPPAPAVSEPAPTQPAAAPAATEPAMDESPLTAAAAPSLEHVTAHLLKLGGLLLMAGGLIALAYAFLRGYA